MNHGKVWFFHILKTDLSLSQMTNFRLLKLKEFADNNFKSNESGRMFWETGRKHCGKRSIMSSFSFFQSDFKRLIHSLQTRKKQGLVWERAISKCFHPRQPAFSQKLAHFHVHLYTLHVMEIYFNFSFLAVL